MGRATMKTHHLKIHPQYFAAVRAHKKNFEIRKDDRGFEVGDLVVLEEYLPQTDSYTGQTATRLITWIARDIPEMGLKPGFVILSIVTQCSPML
jgi:hypothetical protein